MSTPPGNGSGLVTPRELYSQLEAIRSNLGAQIKDVQTTVERSLSEMRTDMATSRRQHDLEHQRDRDKRNSLIRWAVTSIMTGVGLLIALYVAMRGGG